MLTLDELNALQRGFVRALYAAGGSGSLWQVGEHLKVAPEDVLALFHDLPPGWAQVTTAGDLAFTSAGRLAVEQAL